MDPPPPYDPRRHSRYSPHPSHSHASHPQDYTYDHPQPSNSNYYPSNRSRSSSDLATQSTQYQSQSRRADGYGTGTSKHQRADMAEREAQRDSKRSRPSAGSDIRERNSRQAFDSKTNNSNNNSRKNRRNNYDKEKRKNKIPQKSNPNSRVSVWNRIEKNPSAASPSSSKEARPDNEQTGPSIEPVKELDPVEENPKPNPDSVKPNENDQKKKKVIIRRRIVKKSKKDIMDSSTVGSSDPINEISGPDNPIKGMRRVKRVIIVKRKKGTGESNVCNEEEIVRQIANQVFSEDNKISPEKSVNDIDLKPNLGLSKIEEDNMEDNIVGLSTLNICTKQEEIFETPLNVETKIPLENEEVNKETAFSPMQENQEKDNIDLNDNIDINDTIDINDNVDINVNTDAFCLATLGESQVNNDALNGEEEEMPKEKEIQDLNNDALIGTEANDLNLNLNLNLNISDSNRQSDNEGNCVLSTELEHNEGNNNNIHEKEMEASSSEANGEVVVDKGKSTAVCKKNIYQKSVPVPVPKFAASSHLNKKPRHKTWHRDDISNKIMAQNAYIRKGNSLIRSASGSNKIIPRIPSPNPNPNPNSVFERPKTPTLICNDAVISPLHESDGEIEKLRQGSNNNNNKIVYLKNKSNQIVLNSGSSSDKSNSNSDGMKINNKVVRQINKRGRMRFTNVWTLNNTGTQLKRKTGTINSNYYKSIPKILPWKRTTLLKNSARKTPILHKTPTSSLIRKLVVARRRDMVYKVSKDGFSMCKTGVLSLGGSNLKWSRDIDSHSKIANQEATKAVAEAERKKREKRKNHQARKGPKASLNLNKPSASTGYVRASKGNQLVRDPRKLVRILASEKIQRSLHTLRTRYKRKNKQQYCLFYTRFGLCNKTEGKCNYIHDPAKIAICTKFLRGICVNSACKLTHEINPERMPDCSYFLLGLCTNLSCPYRHVKVNPNAPVCDGFLRGYCSHGDECRKKHSYTCPQFEKNGSCPEGPKCKLYHPKFIKSKKRKPSLTLQNSNNARPRYFESNLDAIHNGNNILLSQGQFGDKNGNSSSSEGRLGDKNGDVLSSEGRFGDDLLTFESEMDEEYSTNLDAFEEMTESEDSDLEMDDELIKPLKVIRDNNNNNTALLVN